MELIEKQLTELTSDMTTFTGKAREEIKNFGAVTTETKATVDTLKATIFEMQKQLDAVDAKTKDPRSLPGGQIKSVGEQFTESELFQQTKQTGWSGRPLRVALQSSAFPLSLKTNITDANLGVQSTGVLPLNRMPGIVRSAQQELRIRDMMNVVPQALGNSFDFVYQATRTNAASPQVEASAKSQSYYAWASTSGAIRTIAHYVQVSRQALDDAAWVRAEIDSELMYGLKVKEESEILSGDGTGVHLNGIITQATAFNTSLTHATVGWTRIDMLRYAKLQARLAGLATYAPSAFVLHPTDMAELELTKTSYGEYIIGDPQTGILVKTVWGLPVVESDSISSGTFLVGAFANGATLVDRMAATVEISFEHSTNFTENMATILCEERIGLAVKKAAAFITGTFTTSPA